MGASMSNLKLERHYGPQRLVNFEGFSNAMDDDESEEVEEEVYVPQWYHPKTAEELTAVIGNVHPGDTIELLPIIYQGTFQLPKIEELAVKTVKIIGTWSPETNQGTTIQCPSDHEDAIAFDVNGDDWELESVTISGFHQAASLNGHNNSFESIRVIDCKNGFIIKAGSILCRIQSCKVTGNGGIGTGIEVQGNHCSLISTKVKDQAVGISVTGSFIDLQNCSSKSQNSLIVSEASRGGIIKCSAFDGPSNFAGSDYCLISNAATGGISISGVRNHFRFNGFKQVRFLSNDYADDGGNFFYYITE